MLLLGVTPGQGDLDAAISSLPSTRRCSGSDAVSWTGSSLPLTPQPPQNTRALFSPGENWLWISPGLYKRGVTGDGGTGGRQVPPRCASSARPPCSHPALPSCLARPISGGFSEGKRSAEVSPHHQREGPPPRMPSASPEPPRRQHHHDTAHGYGAGGARGLAGTHVPPC